MKILHTSDWHLDWTTHGVRRHDELKSAVNVIVEQAVEQEVDLFVHSGDLMNPDAGSCVFECVAVAVDVASNLRERGIPSVWVSGNHDVIEDGRGRTTLAPLAALGDDIHVFEAGGSKYIDTGGGYVEVLGLPYPSATRPYDLRAVVEKMAAVDRPHDERCDHDPCSCGAPTGPLVVVSHLSVPGVVLGEESHEMARGRDVIYPIERVLSAMKIRGGVMLQGHYHRRQSLKFGDRWMHIPGSLAQLTFSEEHHKPGFLIVEVP